MIRSSGGAARAALMAVGCTALACATPPMRALRQHQASGAPLHASATPPAPLEPDIGITLLNPLGCVKVMEGCKGSDPICAPLVGIMMLACASTALAIDAVVLPIQLVRRHDNATENEQLVQACGVRDPVGLFAREMSDRLCGEFGFSRHDGEVLAAGAPAKAPADAVRLEVSTSRFARKEAVVWAVDAVLRAPDGRVLWTRRCEQRGSEVRVPLDPGTCERVTSDVESFARTCASGMSDALRIAWDADATRDTRLRETEP